MNERRADDVRVDVLRYAAQLLHIDVAVAVRLRKVPLYQPVVVPAADEVPWTAWSKAHGGADVSVLLENLIQPLLRKVNNIDVAGVVSCSQELLLFIECNLVDFFLVEVEPVDGLVELPSVKAVNLLPASSIEDVWIKSRADDGRDVVTVDNGVLLQIDAIQRPNRQLAALGAGNNPNRRRLHHSNG